MKTATKAFSPSALNFDNEPEVLEHLTPGVRECVHEYGWSIVRAFLDLGIHKPAHIHHLVRAVWLGSREIGNKRPADHGACRSLNALDDLLIRTGAKPMGRALLRVLRSEDSTIVRREPTTEMVAASMAALDGIGLVSKEKKHRIRLRAAIRDAEKRAWPFLDDGP